MKGNASAWRMVLVVDLKALSVAVLLFICWHFAVPTALYQRLLFCFICSGYIISTSGEKQFREFD